MLIGADNSTSSLVMPSSVPMWGGRREIGEVSRAHRFPNQVSFGESISLLLTSPITTIGQTSTVMLAGWLEPKTLSDVHDW